MTPAPSPRRVFLLVLIASTLLQTAWILALPAFGGSDEFDHVYKAEAVADGQLLDEGAPKAGRGGLVEIPGDVVDAASRMCASYKYTGHDNCNPVEERGAGKVTVATAASTYNPVYYAVVGVMARPFHGAAADFAMRAFTAVLATLLLAWAAVVTSGWARNGWPMLALLVTATPVLMYSTAVASPNGVGYAAACLLWAAGLGLLEDPARPRVFALTTAALTLMVTHSTGVMWLAVIFTVIALLQPFSRWREQFRRSPRRLMGAAAFIGAGGLACAMWILLARTNRLEPMDGSFGHVTLSDLFTGQVVWALQTIGAFPLRDDPAPLIVYVLWLVPFVALMVTGLRHSWPRLRLAVLVLLTAWVAVPMALTIISFSSQGLAWQGRYTLPLAIGFPALAGLALNRSASGPRRSTFALTVAVCAAAQAISCAKVASLESDVGLSATFSAAVPGGVAMVAVLALSGAALPLLLARGKSLSRAQDRPTATLREIRDPAPARIM